MLAKLQGDRGADHDLLPVERNGEAADPSLPMLGGLVKHHRQRLVDVADERLVGSEEEVQRFLEPEAAAIEKVDDRGVGGQAERLGIEQEADMVGAVGPLGIATRPSRPLD